MQRRQPPESWCSWPGSFDLGRGVLLRSRIWCRSRPGFSQPSVLEAIELNHTFS
eukprot:SAG31_NODE_17775_length_658_cov_0.919499_1_plen_53_part_10